MTVIPATSPNTFQMIPHTYSDIPFTQVTKPHKVPRQMNYTQIHVGIVKGDEIILRQCLQEPVINSDLDLEFFTITPAQHRAIFCDKI